MTDRSCTLPGVVDHPTRDVLLDAGRAVVARDGLAGLSVNRVVAEAGLAKGTFYVHFADRNAFVDALHAQFHARVDDAVQAAIIDVPLGAKRLLAGTTAYLDVSLADPAVKALTLEARTDPKLTELMAARHDRFATMIVSSLKAMGWPDATAAAQLLSAMTREIAMRELDAGKRLPAMRRALKRFLS
jgi:TetR/AcrR family transcriptional repressor of nem operon